MGRIDIENDPRHDEDMQGTKPPTFRPTVRLWPADPGALPRVPRFDLDLSVPGELSWNGSRDAAEVPGDFVLQEVLEAETSHDGVLDFVKEWGPLSPVGLRGLDLLPRGERNGLVLRRPGVWDFETQRYHLRALRAATRQWLAFDAGDDPCAVWSAEGFNRPRTELMALDWWLGYVNAAVSGNQMHVIAELEDGQSRGSELDFRHQPIYAVAMQQLAQLASSGEQIRHCANDRCGKPFTRQRGRAKYGESHASGVLYCSNLCARAQSERQRRARRTAERKAAPK